MTDNAVDVVLEELTITTQDLMEYRPGELMHYCMLLDTLGDHEGMLNCALTHIHKTCMGGKAQSMREENLQRDMFAVAAKKYITAQLEMSRVLREKKNHIESNSLGVRVKYITNFQSKFEAKLLAHIHEIISVIDHRLIPSCTVEENRVFYYKMLADYFRYSIDFYGHNASKDYMDAVGEALANYRYAMELGRRHLEPTSPIFLAMVLNYTIFVYDMQNNVDEAVLVGEAAFNQAINRTHELDEVDHKESTLLLQLLRDNLQLWKHAAAQDHGDEGAPGDGVSNAEPEGIEL